MPTMGRYCKAYPVSTLRQFPAWQENLEQLREDREFAGGVRALAAEDYLYMQEDLSVTDGIFKDANVVYASDEPEWRAFCEGPLAFKVPDTQ
jgi:hypothetical protein